MSKLPLISGRKLCRILEQIGYFIDHQTGSHIILRNVEPPYRRLTIPDHKEIAKDYQTKRTDTGRIQESFLDCRGVSNTPN